MKVSSIEEMRALDREAIEGFGIPEALLMENAGEAACAVLGREVGVAGKSFVVVCGVGNNVATASWWRGDCMPAALP
jgi:NAD(P)H-hydrate epimerase